MESRKRIMLSVIFSLNEVYLEIATGQARSSLYSDIMLEIYLNLKK